MPIIDASYERLANTTQYAANDAVSGGTVSPSALTFAGCAAKAGGSGWLLGVTAITNCNESTLPEFTLYLFDGTAAPTATNDNAEFGLTDADSVKLLGAFTLDNFEALDETSGTNGNAKAETDPTDNRPIAFTCGAGSTDLYGLVKVENAYTPVSAEEITFRLHVVRE